MKKSIYYLLIIAGLVMVSGCKKHKSDDTSIIPCSAGKGGNVAVICYSVHNTVKIINSSSHSDTAYVKFNASMFPGYAPADYDTFYVSEVGEDHIHCEELKCGDYFIYRTAFDTISNIRYSGTQTVSFSQTSGEKFVYVNVN